MIRIGIIGSDNSHALAFAKLCNIPDDEGAYLYEDIRISAIYGCGDDKAHTKSVAEEGKINFIAEKAEELIGKVDAVMIVTRRGSLHVKEILPFVEKGYPVWIDKPISTSIAEIDKLREACKKNNTLITGGSTLKYNYDILVSKNRIDSGELGKVLGGSMNFPGDLSSEYEGLYFYGSHLIEMMLSIFGYDIKSVLATKISNKQISVIAKYADYMVNLNYLGDAYNYHVTVYGSKKTITTDMDISIIYKLGFEQFVKMLHTGKMPLSFEDLVKPVYILAAIYESLGKHKEITL